MLAIVGLDSTLPGVYDKPLKLVLTSIKFIRSLRKMAKMELSESDAEMLIAIFKAVKEKEKATVDDVFSLLPEGWGMIQKRLSS